MWSRNSERVEVNQTAIMETVDDGSCTRDEMFEKGTGFSTLHDRRRPVLFCPLGLQPYPHQVLGPPKLKLTTFSGPGARGNYSTRCDVSKQRRHIRSAIRWMFVGGIRAWFCPELVPPPSRLASLEPVRWFWGGRDRDRSPVRPIQRPFPGLFVSEPETEATRDRSNTYEPGGAPSVSSPSRLRDAWSALSKPLRSSNCAARSGCLRWAGRGAWRYAIQTAVRVVGWRKPVNVWPVAPCIHVEGCKKDVRLSA